MNELSTQEGTGAEFRRGWPVLLGCLVGTAVGGPGISYYTWGVFLPELESAFGWSRTAMSAAMLLFTVVVALASPYVGSLIDRYGVRRPMAISFAAVVLCYAAFPLLLTSLAAYFLLQVCVALACASSSPLVFTRAVNDWFDRARGTALGITMVGTGLAAAVGPLYVSLAIEAYGWQAGYFALAVAIAVISPYVVWQVRLRQPLPVSGAAPTREGTPTSTSPVFASPVFASARRSRTFWLLLFAFFIMAFGFSGLIIHFVPLLIDAGMGGIEAASIAGIIGIAVIAGRLIIGLLVDRCFAPHVAATVMALSAAGCLALAVFGIAAAPLAAIAVGLAVGAEVDLIGYLVSRYFPMETFGRVYGWQYGAFAIGNGLSPLWFAMVHDHFGSYHVALYGVVGLLLLTAAAFLAMPSFAPSRGKAVAPMQRRDHESVTLDHERTAREDFG